MVNPRKDTRLENTGKGEENKGQSKRSRHLVYLSEKLGKPKRKHDNAYNVAKMHDPCQWMQTQWSIRPKERVRTPVMHGEGVRHPHAPDESVFLGLIARMCGNVDS